VVRAIAVGDQHSLGLLEDGSVVSWGFGDEGQLGNGYFDPHHRPTRLRPERVPGLDGVSAIRAGLNSSAAITPDGLWTWGITEGAGGYHVAYSPRLVAGTVGVTDAALGAMHGLFLIDGVPLDLPDSVATSMTVTGTPDSALVGDEVTFTVNIDPAPDMGVVEMGTSPTNTTKTAPIDPSTGVATFTETVSTAGDHSRYVRFDGVPGFEASSASVEVEVHKRPTSVAVAGPSTRTLGRTQTLEIDAVVTPATAGQAAVYDVSLPGSPVELDQATVDASDGSVAFDVGPLDDGQHDLEVRYLGSDSHAASASTPIDVTVVEGPVAGPPVVKVATGTRLGQGTLPVTVAWDPNGVAATRYELDERVDGGAWSQVSTTLTGPSIGRTLATSRTYEYRVRAVDADDHAGPWIASVPFRARITENTSSAVWYRGTWSSTSRSTAYSGGSARTTTRRAFATLTFTGSGVSWLAALGPARGKVDIYVDGKLVRIQDLRKPTYDSRRLLFTKTWATPGRHTLTIANRATSGRPRFDFDAFLTWTGS
jgi:hypothetical protein